MGVNFSLELEVKIYNYRKWIAVTRLLVVKKSDSFKIGVGKPALKENDHPVYFGIQSMHHKELNVRAKKRFVSLNSVFF